MNHTVADHLLDRLRHWDVEYVFGHPGDGIDGLIAAWGRAGHRPEFVQVRHEETASLAAVGHAKFSGRLGVCVAASGPGALRLLNGLYDAKLDHVPVVALIGRTARSATDGSNQQEVDLHSLFKDVAPDFVETVTVPEQLPHVLDRAVRTAYARRAPTAVIIPADVQELDCTPSAHAFTTVPSGPDRSAWSTEPDGEALERAAEVLNSGDKVAILVGQGAAGAQHEIVQVAGLLGAGIAKALLGKDVLSDRCPYSTGVMGPLGTRPSYEMMRDCDTLLTVGSGLPCSRCLPPHGKARGVQIDIDPLMIGTRYPYEVNLVGDARQTLRRLLPLLRRNEGLDWQEAVCAEAERWDDAMTGRAAVPADPVNPEQVVRDLDLLLPDDVILTADSGPAANWYARHITMRGTMRGSLSGALATTGCAVPYAIGAKFAHPGRPVVALVGAGAMQPNGLAELISVARYRDEWADPRLVFGVLNNRVPQRVTRDQRAPGGAPSFVPSQEVPDVDYAAFARQLGLTGIRVESPEDVAGAWEAALKSDRPAVVEFLTDPSTAPVSPHATWAQIENTAEVPVRGDPRRTDVAGQGFRAEAPGGGEDLPPDDVSPAARGNPWGGSRRDVSGPQGPGRV